MSRPVRMVVLVLLVAATLVGPALAPVGAAAATRPTLRVGDHGRAVVRLQERLQSLHYVDVGPVDGVFGAGTMHAVVAFQKVQGIARDGVVGPVTWSRLADPRRPRPRYDLPARSVEVDLTHQVVYLARDGRIRAIADSSTGSGALYLENGTWHRAVTPVGRFRIYTAYSGWQHSPLGWMYRPHYFHGGYALHGSTSVPPYPASHGCVRVTVATMDRIAPKLFIGMRLAVYRRH